MDLENCAREHGVALTSTRSTDRKKSAESLKDLLTRNALASVLTNNTIRKRGFTWNDLFDDVNDYVLKETEKFETSKTFDNVAAPLCTSLLHMCVAGSNKGQAFIKCDRIIDASLNILKDDRLTKAIGDAYLHLLYKYVLSCDHYLGYITPANWEEMLDVCISVCLGKKSKLDNFTKLRLISLIIKNGKNYCQFIIPLRDSLSRLKKCFIQIQNDKKVQEIVVDIMSYLMEVLSTESRLTLCEFTENFMSVLLKFYDASLEQKKKLALFRLLEMIVILHHPGGKLANEEGSLAGNWDVWKRQLNSISEVVSLEIVFMQKIRKQNDDYLTKSSHFVSLAAAVYFQIFNSSSECDVTPEEGSSSKRQKIAFNKYKIFADLIHQLQLNHLPWLGIIHMYTKNYGASIAATDYAFLIKSIGNILVNYSQQPLNWEGLIGIMEISVTNINCCSASEDEEIDNSLLSLWNFCVRNSTSCSTVHEHFHLILQILLGTKTLKYPNIQPLLKLYLDKSMPVNNSSVMTLNIVLKTFFKKCSSIKQRMDYFEWYMCEEMASVDKEITEEFIIRILSNENIYFAKTCQDQETDHIFDSLFSKVDKCILFSGFDSELLNTECTDTARSCNNRPDFAEINCDLNEAIQNCLEKKLLEHAEKFNSSDTHYTIFAEFIRIVMSYLDLMSKSKILGNDQISELRLFGLLRSSLTLLFSYITNSLQNKVSISTKIKLLQDLKGLLLDDYNAFVSVEIRRALKEDFFHCINSNLTAENAADDDVVFEGDDTEMNARTLKYNCVYVLAAYCRMRANFRDELLDLILDVKLYDFACVWDVKCAYKAIEILNHPGIEEPPLEPVFGFMQRLCKDLFRSPDASFGLLTMFLRMLKRLWSHDDNMKQNCLIMIRGYLERCERLFYPPKVAAILYKCAAEIILLNNNGNRNMDDYLMKAIIKKTKGDIHCLRLYCCYLLKNISNNAVIDIDVYLSGLADIFVINVSDRNPSILKDESFNRTLTVLHSYSALALAKKSYIRKIINSALQVCKEKSLDVQLVKKVLNIITKTVIHKDIDTYLNTYILSVLNFWFLKKYILRDLPLPLFGIDDQGALLEKHMKWLVSADILWCNEGNIKMSSILKQSKEKLGTSEAGVIETCFCNIIVLCLPYIVAEKYKIRFITSEDPAQFQGTKLNAHRLFQMTRDVLENEKWSNLFVENVGELLLLTATHIHDCKDAKDRFHVDVPKCNETYQYSTNIFCAILKYFGELIEGDIMKYLCENQPVAIFKILLKLWENVLQEEVLEHKVLSLHAFVTFTENVPLVLTSEGFVCNYVSNCFAYAIKKSQNKNEVRVLALGLKMSLERMLPEKVDVLRKSLAQVMSILIIKKEEGFAEECAPLLDFLMVDMKEYLKEGEDVVDYLKSMSQRTVENTYCLSLEEFSNRLKTYKLALTCPSYETFCNLHIFLKTNIHFVNHLCNSLNTKGFSEDCETSVIHRIIYELNVILQSNADNKIVIAACNCLSEIGTYDLRTLVTVPPPNTAKVVSAPPKHSFAEAVVFSLSEILFDENPAVTNKVTKTLHCLLKFRDGVLAIESEGVEKTILKPFASDQDVTTAVFKIVGTKFDSFSRTDIAPHKNETHCQWLKRLSIQILDIFDSDANYVNPLREVCSLKPEMCRTMLPPLFGLLLSCSAEKHVLIIGDLINRFFKYIWNVSFDDQVESSGDSSNNSKANVLDQDHKLIVQYMLDVVNHIRLQRAHYKTRPSRLETLNYLNLEYEKVAWAATVAEQHLAAVYYAELAALPGPAPAPAPHLQRILRKSFVSIGEMDAIDGCGTAHLTNDDEKRKHLINTGQYLDAMLVHDIALSCSQADLELQCGTVRSLHKSGMHHLALQYIKSLPESDYLNDIKYECLSYLGDWSEFVDTLELEEKSKEINCNTQSILKAFRYSCLKDCLNIQIKPEFENKLEQPLNRAKLALSRLSQKLNMENCQNFYRVLSKLHLFKDIEDYFEVRCNKLTLYDLIQKWRVENLPVYHDFKYLEDLISQRNLILEHSAKMYGDSLKEIVPLQLQYAELSLSNDRIQMAQRLLAVVKNLQKSEEVTLLESQISWAKGHQDIALSLLRNIVTKPVNTTSPDLRQQAVSLRQYGLWMAESRSDNPRDIIDKYLKKSLDILNQTDDVNIRLKVYFDIAKFADAEYKQVLSYMNSSIFENKVKCLENIKDTASTLKSTQTSQMTRDERKALLTNERFKQLDEAEIASTRAEKESYLHLAMRYYLQSLKECEENNLSVFRVISLWLDNPALALDGAEGAEGADGASFAALLHAIPSRKFITVLPQLAPRLTDDNTEFAKNLREILRRCAVEHPHHTLPILFSLKNSDKDKYIANASAGEARTPRAAQEPRVAAAAQLVGRLAAADARLAAIIAQMERLCDATISFANYKPKVKEQRQKIPAVEMILKLFHLDAIPIPTATVPVRIDCNYEDLCSVVSFDNYFELVGGINCPKKINCKGSDGTKKILLIKGEDDLRQDAVMQQVFNIVNTLLEKNSITNRNKLLIRTYKVVPMSRQSGVLEWCEGTIPIGSYLVGSSNSGAHSRYRPQDISCSVARQKLTKCHELRKSNKDKLAVFLSILREFKPVFHYFFTEHYLDPVTWYERRLAYTKSVATSSMVGYILGLGDRHVQNILIDKNTAEVIHIDFGIAFDQGKALPTPETIPFRLTQDVIAGFGSSGVEGIFRRCCEKTMQLLRDNQETLLTILEVLLCDPLYSWTVAPQSAPASRDVTVCGSGSMSGLAARALLAVSSKLAGTDGGAAGGVAVPGQVARLLRAAADPANLCRLFPGWQPYL